MIMDSPDPQVGILRELHDIGSDLDQIIDSLLMQKEVLKERGLNLPPMTSTTLRAVRTEIDEIAGSLVDEQTELAQLRALADMSAKITTSLDLDTVLQDAMEVIIVLSRAERGFIILKNPVSGDIEFRISHDGWMDIQRDSGKIPKLSTSILLDVMQNGEPLLADNAYKDERFQDNQSVFNFSLRSVLCVPLKHRGELLGAVYVDNRLQSGIFTEREKVLLVAFANTVGVAIANARLYADLQESLNESMVVKQVMDNLFASIGSGVVAIDAKTLITTFNRSAELILECASANAVGKTLGAIVQSNIDMDDTLSRSIIETMKYTLDIEAQVPQRGRVALNMRLNPLKDARTGVTEGVALVIDDLTEKLQRDQQLHVMKHYLPPQMVDQIHTIASLDLGGERREVTSFFIDVRSLATLKDKKPKEMMAILNVYLAVATDCIHEAGGVIDKYMGNEIMVLFNTQLNPQDNHAQLAVECALNIRDEFVALYKRLGIDPDPHFYLVGIHSGVATLGNVGSQLRRDFTAIGDTINLSKRLEENASMGQIIISEDTKNHLEAHFQGDQMAIQFHELEPIQVKGRQKHTRIYEVYRA